jgi:peptide/nickel transport system permease protein
MAKYMARRLFQSILLFLVFITITWFLLYALPGDIVTQKFRTNPNIPPEAAETAIRRLGLDRPILEQFWTYVTGFFRGDFGVSFNQYPRPVTEIIAERLPRTIVLFLTAIVTYYWAGFIAGKYLAWRRGKRGEMAITVGGVALLTVFYPWFALMAIWLLSAKLGLLPISKFLDPTEWRNAPFTANEVFMRLFWTVAITSAILFAVQYGANKVRDVGPARAVRYGGTALVFAGFIFYWWGAGGVEIRPFAGDIAEHLVLPVLVLTLVNFAGIMLLTRSSMLETMREDFILTARAKGLPEKAVRDHHAARTALLPVTTSLVLAVATVIDGGIITEFVFSWPGMGEILISSVTSEDIPLAVTAFSFIGVMALVGHFVVDMLYGVLDPRIRVSSSQ